MNESILNQIMALKSASLAELRAKYAELHEGQKAPADNKTYLWRRIAYRLQEIEYGGLSECAFRSIRPPVPMQSGHYPLNKISTIKI